MEGPRLSRPPAALDRSAKRLEDGEKHRREDGTDDDEESDPDHHRRKKRDDDDGDKEEQTRGVPAYQMAGQTCRVRCQSRSAR